MFDIKIKLKKTLTWWNVAPPAAFVAIVLGILFTTTWFWPFMFVSMFGEGENTAPSLVNAVLISLGGAWGVWLLYKRTRASDRQVEIAQSNSVAERFEHSVSLLNNTDNDLDVIFAGNNICDIGKDFEQEYSVHARNILQTVLSTVSDCANEVEFSAENYNKFLNYNSVLRVLLANLMSVAEQAQYSRHEFESDGLVVNLNWGFHNISYIQPVDLEDMSAVARTVFNNANLNNCQITSCNFIGLTFLNCSFHQCCIQKSRNVFFHSCLISFKLQSSISIDDRHKFLNCYVWERDEQQVRKVLFELDVKLTVLDDCYFDEWTSLSKKEKVTDFSIYAKKI